MQLENLHFFLPQTMFKINYLVNIFAKLFRIERLTHLLFKHILIFVEVQNLGVYCISFLKIELITHNAIFSISRKNIFSFTIYLFLQL